MSRMLSLLAGAALSALVSGTICAASPTEPAAGWKHFPKPAEAPEGAPNVLLIMTDDVGFGDSSTFGGPDPTPALDELAAHGLRYNEFHTTAMCSPSRAALLTGRNHHAVNFGVVSFVATDNEGYTSIIPDSAATIADVLRSNGYSTAWIGKNHNTPLWEDTPAGPFDHWPTGIGFDYFYGFNMSMANQFAPALTENLNAIDPPATKDYFMEHDFADHAIAWLRQHATLAPNKPFFMYYATGTAHSPQQAPADWIAKYKGKFDMGWDRMREETFARQKAQGIIPANAALTPRPAQIPAWDSLSSEDKRVAARLMEIHAAMMAYCDAQIGRVIADLRARHQLDNTMVIFIEGDNGASAEFKEGTRNELANMFGLPTGYKDMAKTMDDLGGPNTWGSYPIGWAWAMDTPFQWAKTIASHLGGMRNGMVISWPKRIHDDGQVRSQFHHLIDIMPTILDAAGVKAPATFHGVPQQPIEGVSMTYTFDHPEAPSTHRSQYFEMLGNRAFYKDGWIASTTPERMPWDYSVRPNGAASYKWELYNLNTDYSQSKDLASLYPAKLHELQRDFDVAARKDHVYPLDDDYIGRINPALRPNNMAGRSSFTYYPGNARFTGGSFPSLGKNWHVSADLTVTPASTDEALIVRGSQFGGFGFYLIGGKPVFILRTSEARSDYVTVAAPDALGPGAHKAIAMLRDTGAGHAAISLTVDGKLVAQGNARIGFMSGDTYIGRSGQSLLVDGTPARLVPDGALQSVEVDLDRPAP